MLPNVAVLCDGALRSMSHPVALRSSAPGAWTFLCLTHRLKQTVSHSAWGQLVENVKVLLRDDRLAVDSSKCKRITSFCPGRMGALPNNPTGRRDSRRAFGPISRPLPSGSRPYASPCDGALRSRSQPEAPRKGGLGTWTPSFLVVVLIVAVIAGPRQMERFL